MSDKCEENLYRSFPRRKDKKIRCIQCGKELPFDARRCDKCGICLEC